MSAHQDFEDYIRKNRDRYTREGITEHLLKQGHSREDIDSAWARLEPAPPAGKKAKAHLEPELVPSVLATLASIGLGCTALVFTFISGPDAALPANWDLLSLYFLAQFMAFMSIFVMPRKNRTEAGALLLTLDVALIAIFFGTCSVSPIQS